MRNYQEIYCEKMGWDHVPHGHEIHHRIPQKDGGTDDFDNLLCICKCDHQFITNIQNSKNPSKYDIERIKNIEAIWEKKKLNGIKIEEHFDWVPSKYLYRFLEDYSYIEKWLNSGGTALQICKDTNNKYGSCSSLNKYIKRYMFKVPDGKTRSTMYSGSRKGVKQSDETKLKISKANKNKKVSKETRLKISATLKGRKLSKGHKLKISEANKGRKKKKEARLKISTSIRGIGKLTENDVKKIKYSLFFDVPLQTLANLFKVSVSNIHSIKSGKTWSHVKI